MLILKLSGKAKQVFAILELLAQKQPSLTLEELEKWIAETIKDRRNQCQN